MKLIISLLLISTFTTAAFSQETKVPSQRAQAVYGELLGSGLIFSAHYDFRFAKKQNGLGMRVGLGFFGGSDGGILTVPVGINHLAGKGPHYFESGIGYTYATFTDGDDFLEGSGNIIIPSVGYRYMPLANGFTARVYLSPLIAVGEDGGWLFWGGFSLGYKF
jgi:hypothetical protein